MTPRETSKDLPGDSKLFSRITTMTITNELRFGIAKATCDTADLSFAAQKVCYRRRGCRLSWDFRLSRREKNDWREGRKEERSVAWFNVFVISANSPTASWERLCDGQTWFTMRKLKIDEERPVFLRTRHILFPEIIRPVISCQRHQDCIARPILLAMKSRVKPRLSKQRKTPKFYLLFLCLYLITIH